MSGTGGYYKYRCKYWLTYNCPNWVWVNNAPCAHCLADGRDSQGVMISSSFRRAQEIYVPYLENGSVQYHTREIVSAGGRITAWILKDSAPYPLPTVTKTRSINVMATEEDLDNHQPSGFDF